MRTLAIDYGTKRVGLAISDLGKQIASPLKRIEHFKDQTDLFDRTRFWLTTHGYWAEIDTVIIGDPINMNLQTYAPIKPLVDAFAHLFATTTSFQVLLVHENYTSRWAKELLGEFAFSHKQIQAKKDVLSALVLLQNYLDATSNRF